MSQQDTATVVTVTAEVTTLKIDSRQVTLSVAKQLDTVDYKDIEPWGRVKLYPMDHSRTPTFIRVIGRHKETGTLCLAVASLDVYNDDDPFGGECMADTLPLIVLAGLK